MWWMLFLVQNLLPTMLNDWDLFVWELFTVFGNPHLNSTSQNTIHTIKMPDKSCITEYIVTFNTVTPYTGYNDIILAEAFYQGLPEWLKDQFQYVDRAPNLVGLQCQALVFDK